MKSVLINISGEHSISKTHDYNSVRVIVNDLLNSSKYKDEVQSKFSICGVDRFYFWVKGKRKILSDFTNDLMAKIDLNKYLLKFDDGRFLYM